MKGIFGRNGSASSRSAALSRSLASRLRAVAGSRGSTLFRMIWKDQATPSGRLIPALLASALRNEGSDCTSWATPVRGDNFNLKFMRGEADGRIGNQARMALHRPWPTPQERDWKGPQGRAYASEAADLPTVAIWARGAQRRFPKAVISGKSANGFPSVTARGVQLNPALSRWLQGLPREWDDCAVTAIPSVHHKPKRS